MSFGLIRGAALSSQATSFRSPQAVTQPTRERRDTCAQELQRLAHFIAVDVRGCLEKREIVERIASSPKVQIVQAPERARTCV